MSTRAIHRLSLLLALAAVNAFAAKPLFTEQPIFTKGDRGFHTYRIPALLMTKKGSILAMCEARKNSGSDAGDIDLVQRRSNDGGVTWGPIQTIHDAGAKTVGNPCPVVDQRTGTIWLPFSVDNKQILLCHSTDDGATWSKPVDITKSALLPNWHWVGPGPGHGIQLRNGRLVIPAWAGLKKEVPFGGPQISYVFYSDDGGKSWKVGGSGTPDMSDECEVVELAPNTMYMTARSRQGKRMRGYHFSSDGGNTWTRTKFDKRLPEPSCQGSIVRVSRKKGSGGRNRIVAAWPSKPTARTHIKVHLSYDECRTWPVSKVVYTGGGAYSDLGVNGRGEVLLAFEKDAYRTITVVRFNMAWLGGKEK